MSNLIRNLRFAEGASAHVQRVLPIGPSNVARPSAADALFGAGMKAHVCVQSLRASYPDRINYGVQDDAWIEYVASAAAKAQCGNCAEHCAVALKWLIEQSPGPDSVDLMGFDPQRMPENADHMFLLIGRAQNSHPLAISSWGPDAAICDPWQPEWHDPAVQACPASRRAYPANVIRGRMTPFMPRGEQALQVLGTWRI